MDGRRWFWVLVLSINGCIEREYFSTDMAISDMRDASPDLTPPCLEAAQASVGIFVSPSGMDDPSCGTDVAPCATLQKGIARAAEAGVAYVFPIPGHYPESITLVKGVTVVGGWNNIGGAWRRICPGDPSLVTVLGGEVAVTATDLGGTAGLESITITSAAAAAQNGRSTYGLFAKGMLTELFLRNVVIEAGDGTQGANGSAPAAAGAPKQAGSCDDSLTPAGTMGGPGNNGMATTGFFDQDGYHPGDGADGNTGLLGGNGLVYSDYKTSDSCSDCYPTGSGSSLKCNLSPPRDATGDPGKPGCGGQGGPGGGGGKGGGSSIALFVFDARVTVVDSQLTAGNGGTGGDGTSGEAGGSPSDGVNGDDRKCYSNCLFSACLPPCTVRPPPCLGDVSVTLSGGTASSGGRGGKGGNGGGGAGGWSVGLVKLGAADVTTTGTKLEHRMQGSGGAAPMPGQSGMALDFYP